MADNFAQLVKQQADIVKIIGDYVRLKKAGAQNWNGLCPFHQEKSPSFSVNAAHSYFYCFGCHEKGDVFTFVMKLDNISFPEAVRAVATKAGIPLPKREFNSPEEAREAGIRRQLIDVHEAATQYFEGFLKSPEAARAREYLTGRGVTPDTIARFRIGYAPEDFNDMRERLARHFPEDVLRASGLFSAREQAEGKPGPMYARFRKRITFPISNEAGKAIAFTARALDDTDDKGRTVAKYLNSPETPLYTKGNVLFNLDKAKADIRTHDFALLVEGQMDCISVFMAGVRNVLATSGTAFTEAQVRLLSRFTHKVIVNFDPDTAGLNAAEKSIALLTEEGFEVKVVTLEGGLDPDRFVRENGVAAYMAALRGARRHADYLTDRARTLFPARTPEAQLKALNFPPPSHPPHALHPSARQLRRRRRPKARHRLRPSPPGAPAGRRRAHRKPPRPPPGPRHRGRANPPPRPHPPLRKPRPRARLPAARRKPRLVRRPRHRHAPRDPRPRRPTLKPPRRRTRRREPSPPRQRPPG